MNNYQYSPPLKIKHSHIVGAFVMLAVTFVGVAFYLLSRIDHLEDELRIVEITSCSIEMKANEARYGFDFWNGDYDKCRESNFGWTD